MTGEDAGFDDIRAGALAGMRSIGLDTTGLSLADGSGPSRDDLVSTALLSDLLEAVREDAATGGALAVMADDLASSHETGTLATRFDPETSGVPAGAVDAKTGFDEEAHARSGDMDAADGTALVFSSAAVGADAHVTDADLDHLDRIAAQTDACGGQLTSGAAAARPRRGRGAHGAARTAGRNTGSDRPFLVRRPIRRRAACLTRPRRFANTLNP